MSLSEKELKSLVGDAVREAMKVSALECPDCHATFKEVPQYLDHRVGEYMTQKLEETQPLNLEKEILSCKDGICKMISDHVEATYNITKKGEAPQEAPKEEKIRGLFDYEEEKE